MSDDAIKRILDLIEERFRETDKRLRSMETLLAEIRSGQQRENATVKMLKDHIADLRRAQDAITDMAEKIKPERT